MHWYHVSNDIPIIRMLNILMVPYTESLGHAGRSLEFAKCLSRNTGSVTIAGGGQFDYIFPFEVIGSPQVPYHSLKNWSLFYLPGLPYFEAFNHHICTDFDRTFGNRLLTLDCLTENWLKILEDQQPDIIIADGRPDVFWAAQILGIPMLGITSVTWTSDFMDNYPKVCFRFPAKNGCDARYLSNFNEVGRRYGRSPVVDCWKPFFGSGRLIPDSILFTCKNLPDDFTVIGPHIWNGGGQCDIGILEKMNNNSPLVYITSGTSVFTYFHEVARILVAEGYQVIFSGGVRDSDDSNIQIRDGIYYCNGLVSGFEIAKKSDLMVCHGGAQTLYQAALAGIYSIVIPQSFEHERNGIMFADKGLASMVYSNLPVAEACKEIIRFLKNPKNINIRLIDEETCRNHALQLAKYL